MLRVLYSLQKARVPPDTPAILGWTGAFACEAHRVALPRFVGEHLFHKQLVVPAIAKVILIKELVLFTPHQGFQGHPASVFALHLLQHARVAILHTTDVKAVQMVTFPPHDTLQNLVELRERGRTGDLHPAPDRRLHLRSHVSGERKGFGQSRTHDRRCRTMRTATLCVFVSLWLKNGESNSGTDV